MSLFPLDDPRYEPKHPPINGMVPEVVERWGPRSQLRWFRRFRPDLGSAVAWDRHYCVSLLHRGGCCPSCIDDQYEGRDDWAPDWCCCRAGTVTE